MTLNELVEQYIEYREVVERRAVDTVSKDAWLYRSRLLPALGHETNVETIKPADITRFFRDKLRKANGDEYAPASIEGYIPAVRQLFRYAVDCGVIATSPGEHLKQRPPMLQYSNRIANETALLTVLASLDDYIVAKAGIHWARRDAFVVSFSADSAARRGEIHKLRVSALKLALEKGQMTNNGKIYHVASNGKTGPVDLRFGEQTACYLTGYLAVRPLTKTDYVLVNEKGGHIGRKTIHDIFGRVCDFAGVDSPFQAHGVRHRNLTDMMRNGADPKVAAQYANHKSEMVTLAIYRHIAETETDENAAALIARRGVNLA